MSHFKVNEDDLFFILKHQLNYGSLCKLDRYRELDEETLDLLVKEALKFARTEIAPLQEIGENWGVVLENGQVRCAPAFQAAFRLYGENGWTAAARDPEYGGQGFPHMMRIVINDLMYGACQAFNMAPSLTHGAAHLIESFGSRELKERFMLPDVQRAMGRDHGPDRAPGRLQPGRHADQRRPGGRPLPDQGFQDLYLLGRPRSD